MYLCELIQGLIAIFLFFILTFSFRGFVDRTNTYKLIYPCFKLGMQFFKYYSIIDS